jgi:hypothetical protein
MANGNGRLNAPQNRGGSPPGLTAWFAIEECVSETLDALEGLDSESLWADEFLTGIHWAVKAWLSWELWAALLPPGCYTPDSLLETVLDRGVDPRQLDRSSPASPPRPGQAGEWRAFATGDSRG